MRFMTIVQLHFALVLHFKIFSFCVCLCFCLSISVTISLFCINVCVCLSVCVYVPPLLHLWVSASMFPYLSRFFFFVCLLGTVFQSLSRVSRPVSIWLSIGTSGWHSSQLSTFLSKSLFTNTPSSCC